MTEETKNLIKEAAADLTEVLDLIASECDLDDIVYRWLEPIEKKLNQVIEDL
jgi:hypothetical protein